MGQHYMEAIRFPAYTIWRGTDKRGIPNRLLRIQTTPIPGPPNPHHHSLAPETLGPEAYDLGCLFLYNNFLYKVSLLTPATPSSFADVHCKAGTSPPPASGVSALIFRLCNPKAEGVNQVRRVQNEVAALALPGVGVRYVWSGSYCLRLAPLYPNC